MIVPLYDGSQNEEDQIKQSRLNKLLKALSPKDSAESIVARYRSFLKTKGMLDTRCALITEGLAGLGMHVDRL
ncbi:hypothetical protein KA478_00625 [Patescibacteria group bacterium]|nr:hypothetical protein [Patescibacteria group bacterium]